jgi:SRSO17 transposase
LLIICLLRQKRKRPWDEKDQGRFKKQNLKKDEKTNALGQSAERLMVFLTSFRKPFVDRKKSLFSKARWVVQGILSSPRKNLQVIARSLGKSDHQALNHFLSDSKWD